MYEKKKLKIIYERVYRDTFLLSCNPSLHCIKEALVNFFDRVRSGYVNGT